MSAQDDLVCVRTCQGWHVAQIYRSKLEAAGIPALLKYESAGLVLGITVDGLGEVRIMVPTQHAARAGALLMDSPEGTAPRDAEEEALGNADETDLPEASDPA